MLHRTGGIEAQCDRVLVHEHERRVRAQHALHLAEDARDVVDLGERVGAEHRVDGVGTQEREIGEVALAELDLRLLGFGALPCLLELGP